MACKWRGKMELKIHMQQIEGILGRGWTRCERGIGNWKITNKWSKVTCKQCLKRKRKKFA